MDFVSMFETGCRAHVQHETDVMQAVLLYDAGRKKCAASLSATARMYPQRSLLRTLLPRTFTENSLRRAEA